MLENNILSYTLVKRSFSGTLLTERRWVGLNSKVPSYKRVAGDMRTLSAQSARDLQKKILLAHMASGKAFSYYCITVTMPDTIPEYNNSKSLPFSEFLLSPAGVFCSGVRKAWNWFQITLTRKFPDVGFIWRVELQKRKSVHWHIVAYCPNDVPIDIFSESRFRELWFRFLDKVRKGQSAVAGVKTHSVLMSKTPDAVGASVYISSHSSKHKRSQLGWIGRQWGVVNAKVLSFEPVAKSVLTDDDEVALRRLLRRLYVGRARLIRMFRSASGKVGERKGKVFYGQSNYGDYLAGLLRGKVSFGFGDMEMLTGFDSTFNRLVSALRRLRLGGSIGHIADKSFLSAIRSSNLSSTLLSLLNGRTQEAGVDARLLAVRASGSSPDAAAVSPGEFLPGFE